MIASTYHWPERDILQLPLARRLAYLLLLEADDDAALLAELAGGAPGTARTGVR